MQGIDTYTISSVDSVAQATFIPSRGGMCHSIILPGKLAERECLFLHDYAWDKTWPDLPGGLPFLFPVCARLARNGQHGVYLYDGKLYQLPMHGFAWQMPWNVVAQSHDSLTLQLQSNAETLSMYPFEFEVRLTYRVSGKQFICEQSYSNHSQRPMPYYAGFHPYFLTPATTAGKSAVTLNYQPVRCLQYNHDLTDIVGEQPLFQLPTSITDATINEQLTLLGENKTIQLIFADGDVLSLCATGTKDNHLFSYVQLYTIPNKPFFCVEPWMAFPNAMNSVSGVRWLAPGTIEHGVLSIYL